jgi:hypothetical protein
VTLPPTLKAKCLEYTKQGNARLWRNAQLCFWRARVEHAFSHAQLGRFDLLKVFNGKDFSVLLCAFLVAESVLNIEMMSKHGTKGRYNSDPVGDKDYQCSLVAQQDRYPQTPTKKRARPGVPTTITDATQPTLDAFVVVASL